MRDAFLTAIVQVLGFGFTLGRLAYDEWHPWKKKGRSNRGGTRT